MLIKAEVITYRKRRTDTEKLAIRTEANLQSCAKIQVFITRSTNKCMSPYRISIIPKCSYMIVDQTRPWFFASSINADTAMNCSD